MTGSRSNKLVLALLATPLVVAGIAAAVSFAGPAAPTVGVTVPPGYRAISDTYYGYAVPVPWVENDSATTATGTYYYQGPSGWAGETVGTRSTPPTLGEQGPAVLGVFGRSGSAPFRLAGGAPVRVPGASATYRYQLVRQGGVVATVYDVWTAGSSTELWLAVHADPATTATVLASLRA